jgi:hypothetical protein
MLRTLKTIEAAEANFKSLTEAFIIRTPEGG